MGPVSTCRVTWSAQSGGVRCGVSSHPAHVLRGPDAGRRFVVIVQGQPTRSGRRGWGARDPGVRAQKSQREAKPRCEASALCAPLSGESLETETRPKVCGSSFPRYSPVLGSVLPPPGWSPTGRWGLFQAGRDARCSFRPCPFTLRQAAAALLGCTSAAGSVGMRAARARLSVTTWP